MRIPPAVLAVTVLVACVAGCASSDDRPARQAARGFYEALQARDAERACALLAPEAAGSLATGGRTCAASVVELDLPGGEVLDAEVWGDEARVRLARDTVFLHRFPTGWLVRGAGCAPRRDLPYDCEVST
ncbi:hypothetical protein [Streptosporangium sp. NPDC023615]|uniref:hypothetical protein n=1 Tax=Streptosporangium sp. NPDC023615 TaxID=3154794 RepID=UPI0034366127